MPETAPAPREVLSTAITPHVAAELRRRAADEDRSVSNFMARLITVALEEPKAAN
jgi:hypothetical protein